MHQYALETLGDERFQHLCQAILVKEYPTVQCLPVGQPDDGRDAFMEYLISEKKSNLTVFQVKYSREPALKSEREAIEDLIDSEKSKIDKGSVSFRS